MQLPTNLLTFFLLTTSSFLSLITATPIVSPSKESATINDPSDPAIAFFSSLPPSPPSSPNPSSPTTTTTTTTSLTRLSNRAKNKDYCRGGGYFNASSRGSPWIDDCKVIIHNISPRGGTWHYMTGTQRTLVSHGSCALGIESTPDVPKGLQTLVGDLDIAEWIQKSIDQFQWSGRVGSYGDTQCVSWNFEGDEYTLRWGLYHS